MKVFGKLVMFLFVVCLLFAVGCDTDDSAEIKFVNSSSASIKYGIRFGKANFGVVNAGYSSGYKSTEEGSYYVEIQLEDGTWEQATNEKWEVKAEKKYTLTMDDFMNTGYSQSYYFSLKLNE